MNEAPGPKDIPLSIEPILGWRAWGLREVGGELRLISLTRDVIWSPGAPLHARCSSRHPVPSQACTCGIYAANSPGHLAAAGVFHGSATVVGVIAMWGTAIEHTAGARSEIAYPARLRLVCAPCLALGRGGIDPTDVAGSGSSMTALCRLHALRRSGPFRPARDVQQQLLAVYRVEVMPRERVGRPLRRHRPRPVIDPEHAALAIVRVVFATIGFILQAYMALMTLLAVVAFGAAVVSGVVQVFSPSDPTEEAPTPAVLEDDPQFEQPTIRERRPPGAFVESAPAFASVCGSLRGSSVRIVRCSGDADSLLGFAREEPERARTDCAPGWDAYSRGHDYSICWIASPGDVDVPRRPESDHPFEPRSGRHGDR
jgi:hypothetical protein